ncbi:glycoside hydrolase family 1 protein [Corynebacterium anserum]|nr:family 1 glycosylhydrolase [Corynebacterium anserum]
MMSTSDHSASVRVPFAIGTSSASTQIEGTMPPSNWTRWAEQGRVVDGTSPNPTTDHWVRWEEDNQLMQSLELQIARVSVEWARIEPRPGHFDEQALQRYVQEYQDLKERGVQPLVTLHHFSHPLWFEDLGAFTREENVSIFLRFARVVVEHLGSIVDDWVTINEPNVYATQAFLFNETPPGGKANWRRLRCTLRNMAMAHIKCYELIHDMLDSPGRSVRVAFAHHVRAFAPMNPKNPVHKAFTWIDDALFNRAVEDSFVVGKFSAFLGEPKTQITPGFYADAIGINYYSRTAVTGMSDGTFPDVPVNDLGWEIFPEGLVESARRLNARYQLPIWVTENGTADNGADGKLERFRCRFLLDHITAMAQACESGVPIERYYHWCFVDNWEWTEGMAQRFGIVAMEPTTLDRVVKPSGYLLRDIIRSGAVTAKHWETYAEPEGYPRGVPLSQPGKESVR